MAQWPAILDTRLIRLVCPPRKGKQLSIAARRRAAIGLQHYPQPPTSSIVDHDRIAELAAKPIHSLTLADLVRYVEDFSAIDLVSTTDLFLQPWPPTAQHLLPPLLGQLFPFPYPHSPRAPYPSAT